MSRKFKRAAFIWNINVLLQCKGLFCHFCLISYILTKSNNFFKKIYIFWSAKYISLKFPLRKTVDQDKHAIGITIILALEFIFSLNSVQIINHRIKYSESCVIIVNNVSHRTGSSLMSAIATSTMFHLKPSLHLTFLISSPCLRCQV